MNKKGRKMETLKIIEHLKTGDVKLKANDIITITGLTYRKLNDWDNKGIIPADRKGKEFLVRRGAYRKRARLRRNRGAEPAQGACVRSCPF